MDSHSSWCLWSQFPPRWRLDTPWSVHTVPGCCTHSLVGACGLSSFRDKVRILPGGCTQTLVGVYTPWLVPVVSVPSKIRWSHSLVGAHTPWCAHSQDRWVGRLTVDWNCCCRGIPQSAPKGLFLFGKILLLSPAAPSIPGRACPLT